MAWAIELSQYDLQYEPRQAIKAQAMAHFLVEVTGEAPDVLSTRWKLHVDGASNQTFGGAGIILENSAGVAYEQSIKFDFPVSNNQAEYEALLGGLILAKEVGASRVEVSSDSQIVTSQINGSYQARDALLQNYLKKIDPIFRYLEHGETPPDEKEAQATKREAPKYVIIQGQLYKRGLHQPLLKCLRPDQTDYVLSEVHEGCCDHHIGGRSLARKIIRAGYYWPTMMSDAQEFIKKCKKCQQNANFHKAPPEELNLMMAPRPFAQWGFDLLGPFPPGPGFGIPETVISDNGTQFTDKKFKGFLAGLKIKQRFSSVEHPQTNGQVEAANKVILKGLKKRLEGKKGLWADELASVLWSYKTTPQSSTGETSFRLTYGFDAVISVEVGEPSPRVLLGGGSEAIEKDLVDETRQMAHLAETAIKQRIALRYNGKVLKRSMGEGDLVLQHNDIGLPTLGEGKLAAN
ncbi:uncharacterized protein LOC107611823 [Arachis ipaensis]|uniref:uncharacterized protein LOC107611823 n=1 Tax=Arachis ipaensis TaxID=130454 RepID=UPI0007AF243E|nr:uncharacterized protein LOC107611823 [Arachis ipaensis]XP_025628622.1 uncharacterized protein LOC112721808 [Arachis hypogaea]